MSRAELNAIVLCPACGHDVKQHRGIPIDYGDDAVVSCMTQLARFKWCECEDWSIAAPAPQNQP